MFGVTFYCSFGWLDSVIALHLYSSPSIFAGNDEVLGSTRNTTNLVTHKTVLVRQKIPLKTPGMFPKERSYESMLMDECFETVISDWLIFLDGASRYGTCRAVDQTHGKGCLARAPTALLRCQGRPAYNPERINSFAERGLCFGQRQRYHLQSLLGHSSHVWMSSW